MLIDLGETETLITAKIESVAFQRPIVEPQLERVSVFIQIYAIGVNLTVLEFILDLGIAPAHHIAQAVGQRHIGLQIGAGHGLGVTALHITEIELSFTPLNIGAYDYAQLTIAGLITPQRLGIEFQQRALVPTWAAIADTGHQSIAVVEVRSQGPVSVHLALEMSTPGRSHLMVVITRRRCRLAWVGFKLSLGQ